MHQRGTERPKKGVELLTALWTRNPQKAPPEYTDYVLCKLLHCTPLELDAQPADVIRLYLEFYNAEQRVEEQRAGQARAAQTRSSSKGKRGRR